MKKPFQPGDRVRVFYSDAFKASVHEDYTIEEILDCGTLVFVSNKVGAHAHPKQCRKLVKKERRRIFIYESAFAEETKCPGFTCLREHPMVFTSYDPLEIDKCANDRLVEFVEVRRDLSADKEGAR